MPDSHAAPLVSRDRSAALADLPYAGGHGVEGDRLGLSLLYYALPAGLRARTSVCLGSGGGFVPCLMRQAQREANLVGSRTYLVDAVLREAGYGTPEVRGGWLSPGSVLRRHYPEIVVLTCRTDEAARDFFGRNPRPIDYLHVDADHSYEGALADFEAFLPCLSPSACVTLHDTRTDGVARVLDAIRARWPDWGCVDFADVGQGLALLRRTGSRYRPVLAGAFMEEGSKGLEERSAREHRSTMTWDYLKHPALYARHAVAAHWLAGADTVLEIGGYETPIASLLPAVPRRVIVVDPLTPPLEDTTLRGQPCEVRFLPVDLDAMPLGPLEDRPYEVVILGMDLGSPRKTRRQNAATFARLAYILSRSRRAVLEFCTGWTTSAQLLDALLSVLRPRVLFECTLDLTQNEVRTDDGPVDPARLSRRIVVLEDFVPLGDPASAAGPIELALWGTLGHADGTGGLAEMADAIDLGRGEACQEARIEVADGALEVWCDRRAWAYSAVVPLSPGARRVARGVVVAEVECREGTVGVAGMVEGGFDLVEERFVDAGAEGISTVEIPYSDERPLSHLLLRNASHAGGPTRAVLHSARVYA